MNGLEFVQFRQEKLNELKVLLTDKTFESNRYEACEVLEVVNLAFDGTRQESIIEVSVVGGITKLCLRDAMEEGIVVFDKETTEAVNKIYNEVDKAAEEYDNFLAKKRAEDDRIKKVLRVEDKHLADVDNFITEL